MLIAFITAGRAVWVQLVNNGAKHRNAHFSSSTVILCGFVACAWLFWHGYREQNKLPDPFLTVEIGDTQDVRNPFATRFILHNNNPFTIYDAWYSFIWNGDLKLPDGGPVAFGNVVAEHFNLPAYSKYSMRIGFDQIKPEPTKGLLQIQIWYKKAHTDKEQTIKEFKFFTLLDNDGHFHWYPSQTDNRWTATNMPSLRSN